MDDIRIAPTDPALPDIVGLLEAGDAAMAALYPAESNHMLDVDALRRPGVTFLAARRGGRAVGCGAWVRRDSYGELKRLFVDPETRGHGLGRRLVAALEQAARAEGIRLLRLETGIHSHEALALYRAAGYGETGPFGDYRPDPLSVFMEKRLGA